MVMHKAKIILFPCKGYYFYATFYVITNLEFNIPVERNMKNIFRDLDKNHNNKIEPNELDESVEPSLKILNISTGITIAI